MSETGHDKNVFKSTVWIQVFISFLQASKTRAMLQLLSYNVLLNIIVSTHLNCLLTPRQFHSQIVIIRVTCLPAFAEIKTWAKLQLTFKPKMPGQGCGVMSFALDVEYWTKYRIPAELLLTCIFIPSKLVENCFQTYCFTCKVSGYPYTIVICVRYAWSYAPCLTVSSIEVQLQDVNTNLKILYFGLPFRILT